MKNNNDKGEILEDTRKIELPKVFFVLLHCFNEIYNLRLTYYISHLNIYQHFPSTQVTCARSLSQFKNIKTRPVVSRHHRMTFFCLL